MLDFQTFTRMFSDPAALDLRTLSYKYSLAQARAYALCLHEGFSQSLPLLDFSGKEAVIVPAKIHFTTQSAKALLRYYGSQRYGRAAMEREISATLAIEHLAPERQKVRQIVDGAAPSGPDTHTAYGIKRGLEFIADPAHKITEENWNLLYRRSINDFLPAREQLPAKALYRDDKVFVVGGAVEHEGLDHRLLGRYMQSLFAFIDRRDGMDQVVKSAVVHYYVAYLHPYYDGNGRMARLAQLWFLVQSGYTSAMFIPFSAYINQSKARYYRAFSQVAQNRGISGLLDVTPFIDYFADCVFSRLGGNEPEDDLLYRFETVLAKGEITKKEQGLFYFALSAYGDAPFSAARLRGDYQDVSSSTVRTFLTKLAGKGLIQVCGENGRPEYRIAG